MGSKVGHEYKLYIGADGGAIGTAATLFGEIRDVTVQMDATEVDATTRANDGWRDIQPGLKTWGMEFDLVIKGGDTTRETIEGFFDSAAKFPIKVLDGAGGEGFQALASVGNWGEDQPLDDVVVKHVKFLGRGKPERI